jgi:hypothetical protein
LLIFIIFSGVVIVHMAQEVNTVRYDGVSNRALVAADAGVRHMIVAIEEQIPKGGLPTPVAYTYPETIGSPTVSYTASIAAGWNPLQPAGDRFYLIKSTGTVLEGGQLHNRTVSAMIKAQSVTTYGSASNYGTNQFGKQVWYTPTQQFNGPVYDGGPMHVLYDDLSTTPIFQSSVKTPNTPIWSDVQGGTTPTTSGDWASIIGSGQSNFSIGGNPIGLPDPLSNMLIASEAYYGDPTHTSSFPPCVAVCMNQGPAEKGSGSLTTGIYINGNSTVGGVSAGSTQTFTITGSFGTYKIKIDFGSNMTTVTKGSSTATYSGVPSGENPGVGNGAIFDDGNATIKLGTTIQGQYVLTVPDFSTVQNNIYITGAGTITYNDPTKDLLGLWANDVVVTSTASNLTIYAAIIAGYPGEAANDGGFYNWWCKANTCNQGDQGTLTLNGSVMENMHGALGKFLSPGVHVGFDRHINYDARLASNPPPFYPVTGNYAIIAWDDEGI